MNAPKFRMVKAVCFDGTIQFRVEMRHLCLWVLIKSFNDEDESFAQREAEELLELLAEP